MNQIKCGKCNGQGTIESFGHVRQGICFDCGGAGFLPEPKKPTIKYSDAFIKQYWVKDLFPEHMENKPALIVFCNKGHRTAEERLILSDGFYYIGQPVCRGSMYYKIPAEDFKAFVPHWNKINKHYPINNF